MKIIFTGKKILGQPQTHPYYEKWKWDSANGFSHIFFTYKPRSLLTTKLIKSSLLYKIGPNHLVLFDVKHMWPLMWRNYTLLDNRSFGAKQKPDELA